MKFIFAILLLSFFSCKTTKYIDRVKVVTDSTVIQQNEGLKKVLAETIERYEKDKENWEKTGIVFDTIRLSDTVTINKVVFDNGKIKSAEGRIKAVNVELWEKSTELLDAHSTIDRLSIELERKEIQLSKKQETVIKEVTRKSFIWWPAIIFLIAGIFLQYKFKLWERVRSIAGLR